MKDNFKRSKLFFEELLQANNLKVTQFRLRLLKILFSTQHPLPADTLLKKLTVTLGEADKVTLYRNLDVLEEKGLICRMYFTGQEALYELRLKDNHHHHLICTSCQKIEDVSSCELSPPPTSTGFITDHHHVEFYGVCKGCQKL